jgi:predicted DCC family thiol-disulfide oxidoreductase YuxK
MATNERHSSTVKSPVVFFDGVCGLCNRFVDFLFAVDTRGIFKVSPLQGELAKKMLGPRAAGPEFRSIILKDSEGLHEGSTAVLRILSQLGGIWRVLGWLRLIPRPLRDFVYFTIARNRYRWFGKKETCRMPTSKELSRFLP